MEPNYFQNLMHDIIVNNPEDKDVPVAMGLAMVADSLNRIGDLLEKDLKNKQAVENDHGIQ